MKTFIRKSVMSLTILLLANVLTATVGKAQYCTPTYYYPCNWYYMYINSFSTTGGSTNITSNNTGCSNSSSYIYYNTRIHTGIQGTAVNFSVTNTPYYSQSYRIWVDFNLDGDFLDAGEQVFAGNLGYGSTTTGSFNIPLTASPGNSRLRVRAGYQYASAPQPCGMAYYGECEDYGFVIQPACSLVWGNKIGPTTAACLNGPGSITVNPVNGAGYQWQVLSGSTFVDLVNDAVYSNVTGRTLNLTNIPSSYFGKKYRCIVTASCGSTTKGPSDTTTLTIHPDVKVTSQTSIDTSCIGLNTQLYFTADGGIASTKWQIFYQTGYIDIAGVPFYINNDTLNVINVPDTLNGSRIRCIVTGVCGVDITKDMTMFVSPVPSVVTDPADQFVKQGEDAKFQVVTAGIGVNYLWQAGYNGAFANINNNGIYNGVKTDRLYITGASRVQDQFEFRCIVSGSGGCAAKPDTSNFGLLNVEPPVSVNDVMTDNSISIYPNPAKGDQLVIKTEKAISNYLSKYTLTDKTGKTLSVGNMNSTGDVTMVNISKLSPDLYFITILDKDDKPVKSLKFTKL